MKFDPPYLYRGGLSGRVFVATHGKKLPGQIVEASVKYDVTDQYAGLTASLPVSDGMVNVALLRFHGVSHLSDIDDNLKAAAEAMRGALLAALSIGAAEALPHEDGPAVEPAGPSDPIRER